MAIKRGLDEKLKVKSIFYNLVHCGPQNPPVSDDINVNSAYEGPCRLGTGVQLTHDYDVKTGAERFKDFKDTISKYPDYCDMMEPSYLEWTDSFEVPPENLKKVEADLMEADFFINDGVLNGCPSMELAKKTKCPSAQVGCCSADWPAGARRWGLEGYAYSDHEDAARHFKILRARKGFKKTRVLFVNRGMVLPQGTLRLSCSNIDPETATAQLGIEFHYLEHRKLIDACLNMTDDQKKRAEVKTDELIAGARFNKMTREHVMKGVNLYIVVRDLLDQFDCNAFTMPCHEVCATRAFNDEVQFTPCMCHSLLKEDGIPSTCELDMNAMIAMSLMVNLTNTAPHMGNTGPHFKPDKLDFTVPNGLAAVPELEGETDLFYTFHAVQTRKMRGLDEPEQSYGLVSFTHAGWAPTIRHDFNEDKGETITLARTTPDAKNLVIIRGKIVAASGMNDVGCTNGFFWKPLYATGRQTFKQMMNAGHHWTWVYGDISEDLVDLCESVDITPVVV